MASTTGNGRKEKSPGRRHPWKPLRKPLWKQLWESLTIPAIFASLALSTPFGIWAYEEFTQEDIASMLALAAMGVFLTAGTPIFVYVMYRWRG